MCIHVLLPIRWQPCPVMPGEPWTSVAEQQSWLKSAQPAKRSQTWYSWHMSIQQYKRCTAHQRLSPWGGQCQFVWSAWMAWHLHLPAKLGLVFRKFGFLLAIVVEKHSAHRSSAMCSLFLCRHASVHEQILLRAIVAEFQATGVEETVLSKVYQQHVILCRFEGQYCGVCACFGSCSWEDVDGKWGIW